jgi:transposase
MPRISRVKAHLTEEEVREKIASAPTARSQQKWMIIHNGLVDPRTAAEIAKHTATSLRTVHQVISDYNREGASGIESKERKGNRPRSYLKLEEEAGLLESFLESAQEGLVTTAGEIKRALENKIGLQVSPSTVYRMLERHGWRKLAPRPYHPKGDKEAREAFKKTFQS